MRVGWTTTAVSHELLVVGGGEFRRVLRDVMRDAAADAAGLRGEPWLVRLDRFRIDPLERHGDLEAPARPNEWIHVVKARATTYAEANR